MVCWEPCCMAVKKGLKNLPPPSDTRLDLYMIVPTFERFKHAHVIVVSSRAARSLLHRRIFNHLLSYSTGYHSCARDPTQNILSCYLLFAACLADAGNALHSRPLLKPLMNDNFSAHIASKASNCALSSSRISSNFS
jgi:hypothetical protein